MELVMCRACGEFTPAYEDGGRWVPRTTECPECESREFIHNKSETVVRTGD
jgi:ribosomal protein S27E